MPSMVRLEKEVRWPLMVVEIAPFGPLFDTPASKARRASGFLFRIGRLSICAFSTVLVTSALVVLTISAPASTSTESAVAPTSRVIGGTEY